MENEETSLPSSWLPEIAINSFSNLSKLQYLGCYDKQ